MSDELTFADLRALIRDRGLDSRITFLGNVAGVTRLDVTRAEVTAWLDAVAGTTARIELVIRPITTWDRVRLKIDRRFRHAANSTLRFGGGSRRERGRRDRG